MIISEPDSYKKLLSISQYFRDNDVDHRKFQTLMISLIPEKMLNADVDKRNLNKLTLYKFKTFCFRMFDDKQHAWLIQAICDFCS